MTSLLAPFVTALALSLGLVPVCRAAARRLGYVAKPRPDRWHSRPTPLLGGVAITMALAGGGLLIFGGAGAPAPLVFCALAMFVVGLADDLFSLKASSKLIAQIVLASVLVFSDYHLNWVQSLTLDHLLTIAWIVGITNAFNLLDNMDGLCAGLALITGVVLLAGHPGLAPGAAAFGEAQYLALLLGAVAGFLVYNVHPASIFMGDSGSQVIGLSIAGLAIKLGSSVQAGESILSTVAVPVLVLLIPILDTTLVTASRLFSGRSAAQGGRDHASHRLVAIGLSERSAVLVLWALAALAGFGGLAVHRLDDTWAILVVAAVLLGVALFAAFLARVRVYEDADAAALPPGGVTPVLVTFMYKRRVLEVALDCGLIVTTYYAAYRLRFEGVQFGLNFQRFLESLPVVLATQLLALFVVGAYRGVWRYFSLSDSVTFVKAVALGAALAQLTLLYLYRFASYSRTLFVVHAALLLLLLLASRASFRLIGDFAAHHRARGRHLIVYGAGDGGAVAVRELLGSQRFDYRMRGFVDDDPARRHLRVHGYPVLGTYEWLRAQIAAGTVEAVVISTRTIDAARVDELAALCRARGVRLLRLQLQLEDLVAARALRLVDQPEAPPRRR